MADGEELRVWASDLSPFALKLCAMLRYVGARYRVLPEQGSRAEGLALFARIQWACRRRTAIRHPATGPLDEYPLVPFLADADGRVYYDSTSLAHWLDATHPSPAGPLVPEAPGLAFVAALIDEYFDEFGLYLVHHNRWVPSADTNRAGRRLAEEFTPLLGGPLARLQGARFPRRQTRRLPYLFSVAPPGLAPGPAGPFPAPPGFPPTHALLEATWEQTLAAMETVLRSQPYLLGARFTLADASAYGQLAMNLPDGRSADRLRELAPVTYDWLRAIGEGAHTADRGPLGQAPQLEPLLELIGGIFVPLMGQNEAAYEAERAAGETRFNERGFDAGRGLYTGELAGHPFRAVAKTFQVQVWRELREHWRGLDPAERPPLPDGVARGLLPSSARRDDGRD